MNELERAERLRLSLPECEIDWLLVSAPVNVRYLTGYSGSNGLALIPAAAERAPVFFTDFRYATQIDEQVPDGFRREIASGELLEAAARLLAEDGRGERLGFEEDSLTVAQHNRLGELLAGTLESQPCARSVERLREIKDDREVARIRAATELADRALVEVLEAGLVGRTEREVAIELELRMRKLGAQAPSFPSIVAGGAHGALPHAEPRDETIERGALVTIDWGAYAEGYCSDCTRTYATGPLPGDAEEGYALVLEAQQTALEAVRAGIGGREADAIARTIIEAAGHGEHFGHGLGHGVGMEIHEAPRLSRTAPAAPLVAGNVVTVEPGVYVPGRFGVRIEDLAVVREDGHERLTSLPKELAFVD